MQFRASWHQLFTLSSFANASWVKLVERWKLSVCNDSQTDNSILLPLANPFRIIGRNYNLTVIYFLHYLGYLFIHLIYFPLNWSLDQTRLNTFTLKGEIVSGYICMSTGRPIQSRQYPKTGIIQHEHSQINDTTCKSSLSYIIQSNQLNQLL